MPDTLARLTSALAEQALLLLESIRPRGVLLRAALRMPEFDPIRSNPRFQALQEPSGN